MNKVNAAQYKVIVPLAELLQEQGLIVLQKTELHAPADFQPGNLQMVVFLIVAVHIKHHGLADGQRVKIHVVREADFPQPLLRGGIGQVQTAVVAVKGYDGVNVVVKHGVPPPGTGGRRWAERRIAPALPVSARRTGDPSG